MADFALDDKGSAKKPSPTQASPEKQEAHASTPQQSNPANSEAQQLQHLQRTAGNAAVQRYLAQRSANQAGAAELDESTAVDIQRQQGSGQQLEENIAQRAGNVMGQDFSDVSVHTDDKADSLSRQLGAKAFTTGNDIFFKAGEYDPHTRPGQELISHELTHVAQQAEGKPQANAPQAQRMTVNDPQDQFEAEADNMAKQVVEGGNTAVVQRAPEEEELQMKRDNTVQRQDEEELQMKPDNAVQRQDEEELQMKPDDAVQRQDEEEELQMKPDNAVQRQDEEEMLNG